MFDQALVQAEDTLTHIAVVDGLDSLLCVFAIRDRVTSAGSQVRQAIAGIVQQPDGMLILLRDWELLKRLNALITTKSDAGTVDMIGAREFTANARTMMEVVLPELRLGFTVPELEPIGVLLPTAEKWRR